MIKTELLHLIITYKYAILVPLAFVEGHLVSLLSGFLSRTGLLNPFIAGVCIVTGNLLGDVGLYWLGYYKSGTFYVWVRKYFGITDEKLSRSHKIFHSHKSFILLFSKLTNGFGLAMAILVTAGTIRIKFSTYMFWNFIGECVWTGGLICIGYFLGGLYEQVNNMIIKIGLISLIIIFLIGVFLYFKNYLTRKIKYEN